MGFLDKIIKPKYKHKDAWIREEAVKTLTDQNILEEIAENDSNDHVRKEAIERITSEKKLIELAKKEKTEYVLITISLNPYLTNQEILADIIKRIDKPYKLTVNDRDKREYILDKITNQELLADIAKNATFNYYNKENHTSELAFNRVEDINLLEDISENANDEEVKKYAIWKIKDLKDENIVNKLFKDEEELIKFLENSDDDELRSKVVKEVDNQEILFKLSNDENMWIRYDVASKINDKKVLEDMLKNDSDVLVRKECLKRIISLDNENFLDDNIIEILRNEKDSDIIDIAFDNLNSYNQTLILAKDLANNTDDFIIQEHVIERVNDNDLIHDEDLIVMYEKYLSNLESSVAIDIKNAEETRDIIYYSKRVVEKSLILKEGYQKLSNYTKSNEYDKIAKKYQKK